MIHHVVSHRCAVDCAAIDARGTCATRIAMVCRCRLGVGDPAGYLREVDNLALSIVVEESPSRVLRADTGNVISRKDVHLKHLTFPRQHRDG